MLLSPSSTCLGLSQGHLLQDAFPAPRGPCSLPSSVVLQASGIVPVFPARWSSCRRGSLVQLQRS